MPWSITWGTARTAGTGCARGTPTVRSAWCTRSASAPPSSAHAHRSRALRTAHGRPRWSLRHAGQPHPRLASPASAPSARSSSSSSLSPRFARSRPPTPQPRTPLARPTTPKPGRRPSTEPLPPIPPRPQRPSPADQPRRRSPPRREHPPRRSRRRCRSLPLHRSHNAPAISSAATGPRLPRASAEARDEDAARTTGAWRGVNHEEDQDETRG